MILVDGRVPGWLIPGDIEFLRHEVSELQQGAMVLEIGSYLGGSTYAMGSTRPDLMFHCVDTWEGSPEHEGRPELETLYSQFVRNTRGLRVLPMVGKSSERLMVIQCEDYDMALVDGGHDYNTCMTDISMTWPKLRSGGVMLVHDCVPESDVDRAVAEHAIRCGVEYRVFDPPRAHFMARLVKP